MANTTWLAACSAASGIETAIVTALADNPIGRLHRRSDVAGRRRASYIFAGCHFDGVGRRVRNGLNFTERGFGLRAALGCSDRGHTAISQMKPGDVDWEQIFQQEGRRWFHTGGIFAPLCNDAPRRPRRDGSGSACRRRRFLRLELSPPRYGIRLAGSQRRTK